MTGVSYQNGSGGLVRTATAAALYVIAVNGSGTQTTVPFRVDTLGGRVLTVLDEGRTIKPVKKVYFRDSFAPYQVYICIAAP